MASLTIKTLSLSTALLLSFQSYAKELQCDQTLADFQQKDSHNFPGQWDIRSSSDKKKAIKHKSFEVLEEDGMTFLRATHNKKAITLHKKVEGWNIDEYPYIEWTWRAQQLPEGGNEDKSYANDAGASLYVIWESSFVMRVKGIKFTWSSTLPPGSHISKRMGHDHVHVMNSGTDKLGQWQTHRVNIKNLFMKYFGKSESEKPVAIAILSDADATESVAQADYANVKACRVLEERSPAESR